jgi:hypothetical protein
LIRLEFSCERDFFWFRRKKNMGLALHTYLVHVLTVLVVDVRAYFRANALEQDFLGQEFLKREQRRGLAPSTRAVIS